MSDSVAASPASLTDHRSPGQLACDLACDLAAELAVYAAALERIHAIAPTQSYRIGEQLRAVRLFVADVEVYLNIQAHTLPGLQPDRLEDLAQQARRARQQRPVPDYEQIRDRLRPGGFRHNTALVGGETAGRLDQLAAQARDAAAHARLGRSIKDLLDAAHPRDLRTGLGRRLADACDHVANSNPTTWPNRSGAPTKLATTSGDGTPTQPRRPSGGARQPTHDVHDPASEGTVHGQ